MRSTFYNLIRYKHIHRVEQNFRFLQNKIHRIDGLNKVECKLHTYDENLKQTRYRNTGVTVPKQ